MRLGQGFVGQGKHGLGHVTRAIGRQAHMGNRLHICSTCGMQADQAAFQGLGQLHRIFTDHARGQYGELATAIAGNPIVGLWIFAASARQVLTHGLQQLVGALPPHAFIQTSQVVDPQQQQVARAGFFEVADLGVQLHLEIAPVSQSGQGILKRLDPQLLGAIGLLLEQCLELFHHLVHGLHHTP
ncbi:hypothetical protein D3C80_1253920 [compost metagenome]